MESFILVHFTWWQPIAHKLVDNGVAISQWSRAKILYPEFISSERNISVWYTSGQFKLIVIYPTELRSRLMTYSREGSWKNEICFRSACCSEKLLYQRFCLQLQRYLNLLQLQLMFQSGREKELCDCPFKKRWLRSTFSSRNARHVWIIIKLIMFRQSKLLSTVSCWK